VTIGRSGFCEAPPEHLKFAVYGSIRLTRMIDIVIANAAELEALASKVL